MSRRAIFSGITGQDGPYVAELPFDRGYDVTGIAHSVRGLVEVAF